MHDNTQKFTGRAEVFAKSRPTYPRQILEILKKEIGFDSTRIVADVGSGTGILAKLFLENGNQVYAVEPNDDMRQMSESLLEDFSRFVSIEGSAEATTLEDKSVDLISVGQALHWFDPKQSWKEFSRIKSDGYLSVVYNERIMGSMRGIMTDYEEIAEKYGRNKRNVERIEGENLPSFFDGRLFEKFSLANQAGLGF